MILFLSFIISRGFSVYMYANIAFEALKFFQRDDSVSNPSQFLSYNLALLWCEGLLCKQRKNGIHKKILATTLKRHIKAYTFAQ